MVADTLGQRIRKAREAKGLARQQDLADLVAGGRSGTVSEWETDAKAPSYEKMVELIRALCINGHWLLTGEGDMERQPVGIKERRHDLIGAIVDGKLDKRLQPLLAGVVGDGQEVQRTRLSDTESIPPPGEDGTAPDDDDVTGEDRAD